VTEGEGGREHLAELVPWPQDIGVVAPEMLVVGREPQNATRDVVYHHQGTVAVDRENAVPHADDEVSVEVFIHFWRELVQRARSRC
jgi:hypothetical protein